jgi:hypothetical protein
MQQTVVTPTKGCDNGDPSLKEVQMFHWMWLIVTLEVGFMLGLLVAGLIHTARTEDDCEEACSKQSFGV